jgi:hypothetical protein
MASQAGIWVEEYASLAGGTRIFTAEEALASLTGTAPTDLGPMAEKVAAFLPASGLVETEPTLDGLSSPRSPRTTSTARADDPARGKRRHARRTPDCAASET